jgi:hypothetical protein
MSLELAIETRTARAQAVARPLTAAHTARLNAAVRRYEAWPRNHPNSEARLQSSGDNSRDGPSRPRGHNDDPNPEPPQRSEITKLRR